MRIKIITSIILLNVTEILGQAEVSKLKISPLTDSCYVFTTYQLYNGSPFPSNGMYFLTGQGVVMIDSPWDTTQFQPLMDSIWIKHHAEIVLCIATHSHKDRTNALDYLKQKGIKTYTSYMTDEISKVRNEKRAEFLFVQDTFFQVGNYQFQTYYGGAGHTPDNIVIWFDREKILYGGCLVKSVEAKDLGNLADANLAEYPGTIKKIQEKFKEPRFIIPGHQGWTGNSLKHTLMLLVKFNKK